MTNITNMDKKVLNQKFYETSNDIVLDKEFSSEILDILISRPQFKKCTVRTNNINQTIFEKITRINCKKLILTHNVMHGGATDYKCLKNIRANRLQIYHANYVNNIVFKYILKSNIKILELGGPLGNENVHHICESLPKSHISKLNMEFDEDCVSIFCNMIPPNTLRKVKLSIYSIGPQVCMDILALIRRSYITDFDVYNPSNGEYIRISDHHVHWTVGPTMSMIQIALDSNTEIVELAENMHEDAYYEIIDMYSPGSVSCITSHKQILKIIADKVDLSRDDPVWLDIAAAKKCK